MKPKSLILCPQARCHCNRRWCRQRDEKCWQTTACQQWTQITEFIRDSFGFLLKQILLSIHRGGKNIITNAYGKITLNHSSWTLKRGTEQKKKTPNSTKTLKYTMLLEFTYQHSNKKLPVIVSVRLSYAKSKPNQNQNMFDSTKSSVTTTSTSSLLSPKTYICMYVCIYTHMLYVYIYIYFIGNLNSEKFSSPFST